MRLIFKYLDSTCVFPLILFEKKNTNFSVPGSVLWLSAKHRLSVCRVPSDFCFVRRLTVVKAPSEDHQSAVWRQVSAPSDDSQSAVWRRFVRRLTKSRGVFSCLTEPSDDSHPLKGHFPFIVTASGMRYINLIIESLTSTRFSATDDATL